MAIEIAMNTPLADALNSAIQPKLVEVGWATGGADDGALTEYILLMLVNGKNQDQIATELAGDLLGLSPDDPGARDFSQWLFHQIETLNAQINGTQAQANDTEANVDTSNAMDDDINMGDMGNTADGAAMPNAPTGPKSMRSGNGNMRGGRDKRMFGQVNKAMDRTNDSVLHRVRNNGNERINSHGRGAPSGPRGAMGGRGGNRMNNNRMAGIAAGLNNMSQGMPGMPGMPGPPGMNGMGDPNWMMQGNGQDQIFNLLQQQNQMMAALQQQLAQTQQGGRGGHGRSLFDRTNRGRGRGGRHNGSHGTHQSQNGSVSGEGVEGEDVEMGQKREVNPDATVCKFNLACTNSNCKFAHQSPAAPPNVTIDVNDVCSFGAACKNFKCVGRHPSPATKRAHQSEQECKFYPNCSNPKCPFKHPDMPPCRNGGDCSVEGCKFTHLQTMCRFKPCTNRYCLYKHEDGQRGTFQDKVWTADGSKGHVSNRTFVGEEGGEELVKPGGAEAEAQAMDEGIA